MGKLYRLKIIFQEFGIILVSIFFLFAIIPVVFVSIIIPIFILRVFAIQTAKFNKTLGDPLSLPSCHSAIDDIYGTPKCSLVAVFYLKERLDVDKLLERVAKLLDSDKVTF